MVPSNPPCCTHCCCYADPTNLSLVNLAYQSACSLQLGEVGPQIRLTLLQAKVAEQNRKQLSPQHSCCSGTTTSLAVYTVREQATNALNNQPIQRLTALLKQQLLFLPEQ